MEVREIRAPKLTVELVPETCWGSNLRGQLPQKQWDWLRRRVYREAGWRCETCGQKPDAPLHCHEVWSYVDERGVQKLAALTCLCPRCHEATHPGHANVKGHGAEALEWLMRVNSWPEPVARDYQAAAFAQWEERSQREWSCDLSLLRGYGVPLPAVLDSRGHQRRVIG